MALKVTELVACYPGNETHRVLNELSLEIGDSGCVAVVGPSGSGKSTLGRVLNGLHRPTAGAVQLDGVDLQTMPSLADARRRIALLMQQPDNQLFGATVGQDIRFGPSQAGLDEDACLQRMEEAMTRVGLDRAQFAPRSPFSLSGGERRRVAIAGLLATQPQHLVLDEPVAGLDPAGRDSIEAVIAQTARELNVIVLTADLPLACRLADRLVLLDSGKVAFDGAPQVAVEDHARLLQLRLVVPAQVQLVLALRARGLTLPPFSDVRPTSVVAAIVSALKTASPRKA